MKIERMLRRFMAPTDDSGSDLGGGGAVDRGDTSAAPVVEPLVDTAETAEPTAGADARDDKGRFTKKGDDSADSTHMIPKARFDQQVGKERSRAEAAERRAAELEAQIKQVGHNEDLAALEKEIDELSVAAEAARKDGNDVKVNELNKELRMKERQANLAGSGRISQQAKAEMREEMRLDLTIEKLEALHPVLNEKDETYDQDIVDLVLATQRDLIGRERMAPSQALEEATKKVMGKLMPANSDGVKPEKGGLKDAEGVAGRKEAQVKKNLDTATKQPASMKESGVDSDKAGQTKDVADAGQMSYEEFAALPEATKAKMRGDLI